MGKTYYIDIDGTICTNTDGDYESADILTVEHMT